MKILVVEDDILQSSWLERSLGEAGHEIHCASDGDDALRAWKLHHPDVVVTDYRYPGRIVRNGLELVAAVRSIDPLQAFVIQTSERNLAAPFGVKVLRKPYPIQRLLRLMKMPVEPLLSQH